jgi:hypothetical protein
MIGFGLAAFLIKWFDLEIPIIGTTILSDPRELFVTLGAAFTGPLGGLVIGGLSTLPNIIRQDSIIAIPDFVVHIIIGALSGYMYKIAIYERLRMPVFLVGWAALIIGYYLCLILLIVIILFAFLSEMIPIILGAEYPPIQVFIGISISAIPELIFTLIITTLIMIALPQKYRRPLW